MLKLQHLSRALARENRQAELSNREDPAPAPLTPVVGQAHGTDNYSCFQCDADGSGGLYYRERTEPTHWWLGLDGSGQAQYCCTGCAPSLFNVRPVRD